MKVKSQVTYFNKLSENIKHRIDYFRVIPDGNSISDRVRLFLCAFMLQMPIGFRLRVSSFQKLLHVIFRGTILKRLGYLFSINALDDIDLHTNRYFEKEIVNWFTVPDNGVFLDIGANIGRYTVIMGKRVGHDGRVLSFEPCSETYSTLVKNIHLNGLENVESYPIALWNRDGVHTFYTKIHAGGNSLIEDKDAIDKNIVTTRTLDGLLCNLKVNKIDLIKIDVEGSEKEVLEGMRKTLQLFTPRLIIEIQKGNELWVNEFLNSIGYGEQSKQGINYLYEKIRN